MVTVYTSSTCHYCHELIDWLCDNEISFNEKNVSTDSDARKELMLKGFMGVPVTNYNGTYVQGFDIKKLSELLLK